MTSHRFQHRPQRRPGGFTLTELLVVMAIIVLALTMAVPAIRALTGTRSEQAAQNTLSSFLVRARTEAIGLQKVEGVMFFIDPATSRVTCAQVMEVPPTVTPVGYDRPGVTYLDLAPDHDMMTLPPGVLLLTMKDSAGNTTTANTALLYRPNDRYLGFNALTNPAAPLPATQVGGVILFNAEGRAVSRPYGFHLVDIAPNNAVSGPSSLGRLLGFIGPPKSDWPSPSLTNNWQLRSQFMLVLLDREVFEAQNGGAVADGNNDVNQTTKEAWLDQNATPIFINRYDGTLIRAE